MQEMCLQVVKEVVFVHSVRLLVVEVEIGEKHMKDRASEYMFLLLWC